MTSNVIELNKTAERANRANKYRAIALATAIASASDDNALLMLDKIRTLHSAAFVAIVYAALESLS